MIRFANRRLANHDADLQCAFTLFWGVGRGVRKEASFEKIRFPSATTRPTENEAKAALARLLVMDDPPSAILRMLASAFDPDGGHGLNTERRLKFERPSQGHSDRMREAAIAQLMYDLCGRMKYKDAADEVSRQTGISDRQVKRIYAKRKKILDLMTSDKEQMS